MPLSSPPKNPAGQFEPVAQYDEDVRRKLIDSFARAPQNMKEAVAGLTTEQLDTVYRNWSIRQIVHHLADSHAHIYIRFKWTLTEDRPLIKAYEEADWVLTEDCRQGDVEPPLALLTGLHAKLVQVLSLMTPQQYSRTFDHPQSGDNVSLWAALNYYAWHARHHTAQITWLREQQGF